MLPVLQATGYGCTKKDAVVMVYGGLRGAIGLALGLIVENQHGSIEFVENPFTQENKLQRRFVFCLFVCLLFFLEMTWDTTNHQTNTQIKTKRDRVLFLISGIVFLTLIVNATTIKYLVNHLKLNKFYFLFMFFVCVCMCMYSV